MKQADQLYRPETSPQNDPNVENLNVDELRDLAFKRTGKHTRFRKREKLLDSMKEVKKHMLICACCFA